MSDKRSMASYVLSISIASLAAAIFYFTLEVTRLVNALPIVIGGIETVSTKIDPLIKQVDKVGELVKPILGEVTEVRKQIPIILEEVKQTRALVPSILSEVKSSREMVPSVLSEIKQTRKLVPSILKEVKKTREAIPSMLVNADKVVTKAGKVGKSTSEGAVTGLFTGIIKAPFKLVGGLGSAIFSTFSDEDEILTQLDREIMNEKLNEILMIDGSGSVKTWKNPKSKRNGSIELLTIKSGDEKECREFNMKIWLRDELESHSRVTACLNEDAAWKITQRVNLHE